MVVNFPPGFLNTLSEKTRKELLEKCATYEYESVIDRHHTGQLLFNRGDNRDYYQAPDGSFVAVKFGSTKRMADKTVATVVGFTIEEKLQIPNDLLRMDQLLKKEKELEELKKSIESIKNAFK